ncbi:MAG: hypothetical protein K2M09_04185 [Muribaculaceae bacterium]|nr:hypothetical protein [Muribaculaceae bacterium]
MYESLELSPSEVINVKAEESRNIYRVNLFAYLDEDSADKTCTVISASGDRAEELEGKYVQA